MRTFISSFFSRLNVKDSSNRLSFSLFLPLSPPPSSFFFLSLPCLAAWTSHCLVFAVWRFAILSFVVSILSSASHPQRLIGVSKVYQLVFRTNLRFSKIVMIAYAKKCPCNFGSLRRVFFVYSIKGRLPLSVPFIPYISKAFCFCLHTSQLNHKPKDSSVSSFQNSSYVHALTHYT